MDDLTLDKKLDHLTPEYYKARRGLMLFSGLLIAWELIGIELSPKLNIDSLNLDITIKSPQAAPAVLIILILYFSLRTAIEWHQSPLNRRKENASKADIIFSSLIPLLSLSIFAFQSLSKVQIADIYDKNLFKTAFFAIIIPFPFTAILYKLTKELKEYKTKHKAPYIIKVILLFNFAILWLNSFVISLSKTYEIDFENNTYLFSSTLISIPLHILGIFLSFIFWRFLNRNHKNHSQH